MLATWTAVVVTAATVAALGGGLWWALADFVLDRLGPRGADYE